jgi:hypothetical protein
MDKTLYTNKYLLLQRQRPNIMRFSRRDQRPLGGDAVLVGEFAATLCCATGPIHSVSQLVRGLL